MMDVLLVEDELVNQLLARRLLEQMGHRVVVARNGAEAVLAFTHREFDVVLMDLEMPVMDGFAATTAIRAHEAGTGVRRTPIIALTAHETDDHRGRCGAAGMDDRLVKPVTRPTLTALLARVFEPEPRALDPAVLDEYRASAGDDGDELIAALVGEFEREAPQRIRAAEAALRAGDAPALRKTAHALKGSASVIGAEGLVLMCRAIEHPHDDTLVVAARLVPKLGPELERVKETLHAA